MSEEQSLAKVRYVEVPAYGLDDDAGAPGGLFEYWRIIRRRKGTIILLAGLGLIASVLLTLPRTPLYQARAAIEIQNMNQDFMNSRQLNPVSSDNGNDYNNTDVMTQIKILESETLEDRVAAKLKAAKPAAGDVPASSRIAAWRKALNLAPPKTVDAREDLVESIVLKARASGQTRIVELTADSIDPKLAAEYLNTAVAEYIEQNIESRWQMTQHTGEWLTKQLEDVRIRLEKSEDGLQDYARRTGLLYTSEKTNVSEDKLKQLQEELSKAQGDRMARQSKYEIASTADPAALADVLNDSSLRDYQSKLTELSRQHAELSDTFTPEDRRIRRIQAQIGTVERSLDRERAAIVARIENDFAEARRREKLLQASYTAQAQMVSEQNEKAVQYNILKREVDTNRQIYDAMLQKVKESGIASAMRASNIRVVDYAKVPEFPYKPSIPMNAAVGLMGGLFCGLAFVIVRERADRTLQEPGDASFFLELPELGVIPAAGLVRKTALYTIRRKRLPSAEKPALPEKTNGARRPDRTMDLEMASGNGLLKLIAAVPGEDVEEPVPAAEPANETPRPLPEDRVELITYQHKPSVVAESFRSILASLLFTGENGLRPKVIVVTSASPSEGKTTVVSNLAIAMAEIKRRVLVIDADLRKPRMHDIFGVPNEDGLSVLLQEREPDAERLRELVQATAIENLWVLPSGPAHASAANVLHSPVLGELLRKVKGEYDLVLVDTPPMLQMPDARVVGRKSDGVVLVTRSGATSRDAALAAKQRFTEDGTRMLGVVLDDWNPRSSGGGYYYGGGYKKYGYYSSYVNHDRG